MHHRCFYIFALLCMIASGCATRPDGNHFYFAQITDTHLSAPDSFGKTGKVIDAVNRLPVKPECVLHTGDITTACMEDTRTLERVKLIFAKLTPPLYLLPGNCDLSLIPGHEKAANAAFEKNFGDTCQFHEVHGVVFITVDVEPICKQTAGMDERFRLLKSLLDEAAGRPVILCLHTPPAKDFYENQFHDAWPPAQLERFEKLLARYNVQAVIAGHFHRDEQHAIGAVPVYVCPSVTDSSAYRIYEYTDGKLTYSTQTVE